MQVRYEDWYRYDPINDRQVVRLLAITGVGTYTSEFENRYGEDLRKKRDLFKVYVADCIEQEIPPHEVDIEELFTQAEYLG